jgi:hypothetical protein
MDLKSLIISAYESSSYLKNKYDLVGDGTPDNPLFKEKESDNTYNPSSLGSVLNHLSDDELVNLFLKVLRELEGQIKSLNSNERCYVTVTSSYSYVNSSTNSITQYLDYYTDDKKINENKEVVVVFLNGATTLDFENLKTKIIDFYNNTNCKKIETTCCLQSFCEPNKYKLI